MSTHLVGRSAKATAGVVLLAMLLLSPLRHALESRMSLHMLVQFPALMIAGALLSARLPGEIRRMLSGWNQFGLGGLSAFVSIFAVLMIPRVLDLALVDLRVEALKVTALLFCGAVLKPSWQQAGPVVQGFVLGQFVPMTVLVGSLYEGSSLRLCNAYRLDDQQQVGRALMGLAAAVALMWMLQAARRRRVVPASV